MTRYRQMDILVELIELCREQATALRQQLTYYRASVYKSEMAAMIKGKIEELRMISLMIGDEWVSEPFQDYDMRAGSWAANCAPGECSLSHRVSILMTELDHQLEKLLMSLSSRAGTSASEDTSSLEASIRAHHTQILQLCRQGSKQQLFFESFK